MGDEIRLLWPLIVFEYDGFTRRADLVLDTEKWPYSSYKR